MNEALLRFGSPAARRLVLAGAAALALAGCVNPAFRETTGQFGAVTKAAVGQQNDQLQTISSNESERIRADLAASRAVLVIDPACAATLTMPTGPAEEGAPAAVPCKLTLQGGDPIEEVPKFENILALSAALTGYADGLIALTSDSTADQQAFTQSLSGLATSLGTLDGAVQKATGAAPADRAAKFGAVATLVAEAGNLYFAHRRNNALKRIVIAGDPLVQEAVALLSGAGEGIDLYNRADLGRLLSSAQDNAQDIAQDPNQSEAAVRSAQNALFAALDAYNNYGADRLQFRQVGEAHAKLAQAARSGASLAEMKAAVAAVAKLAGTARTTFVTLKGDGGSNGDANQDQ